MSAFVFLLVPMSIVATADGVDLTVTWDLSVLVGSRERFLQDTQRPPTLAAAQSKQRGAQKLALREMV